MSALPDTLKPYTNSLAVAAGTGQATCTTAFIHQLGHTAHRLRDTANHLDAAAHLIAEAGDGPHTEQATLMTRACGHLNHLPDLDNNPHALT